MSSSQKKVIVRRFGGDLRCGYLAAAGFVENEAVSLLDLEGRIATIPLPEIKTICYVRDFNLSDGSNPERLLRRSFLARPRGDGLWVRLTFRSDGDQLEGLAPADKSLVDEAAELAGFHISPPDTRSNTQRIFVPRLAIASLSILAVISSPTARGRSELASRATGKTPSHAQEDLFAELRTEARSAESE